MQMTPGDDGGSTISNDESLGDRNSHELKRYHIYVAAASIYVTDDTIRTTYPRPSVHVHNIYSCPIPALVLKAKGKLKSMAAATSTTRRQFQMWRERLISFPCDLQIK
jgi:hypothetical protein